MSGPDTWGPHGWKFIHYVTLGYPSKPTNSDKIKYKNFFISLSDVIPCILCKMNYKKHLQELPINESVLKNRQTLMAWAIKMHNLVNIENDKKPVSISDGIKMIKNNDDTCSIENFSETKTKSNSKMKNFVTYCPMIIFGIILIYQVYLMKFKKK
tara:strand:- start:395 stop:859 length:465 start_codon:yes stop_codon:yes gene_type:complete